MKFEVGQVWIDREKSKWRILATDANSEQPVIAVCIDNGDPGAFYSSGRFSWKELKP